MVVALLIAALAIVVWFVRDDWREFARFKALRDSAARRRRFRVWIVRAFTMFLGASLVGLALLGRLPTLVAMPAEFAVLAASVPHPAGADAARLAGMMVGAMLAGSVLATLLARRTARAQPVTLGDVAAILPRDRAELAYGALLSLNAGVTEEVFFRLFLPLLLTLASGSAVIAFALATLIFGLIHFYQGAVGVVATTVLGAVLAAIYLATGSLWIAIAVHVVIDLNALVLRPLLSGAWRSAPVR